MTRRGRANIEASVRQRLLNAARAQNRPFQELLQYYAMERFLYRLSQSRHADTFILKGALMLVVWAAPLSRPTMDIDLLGYTGNTVETIVAIMQEVCSQKVEPDGVIFEAATVTGRHIIEDADYEGVRVRFQGKLGTARIPMQLDIGFGDMVIPAPERLVYPTLLEFSAPILRGYSRESAIAEKFEAMVKLGELNSRMKDFFDIWLLARQFDFDGSILADAVATTFSTRGTILPLAPTAFLPAFAQDQAKAAQWRAFLRRNRLDDVPQRFEEIVVAISAFLSPVAASVTGAFPFQMSWRVPGPWQE